MSEPAELIHGALLRVADFLRKLPPSQLADLAAGDARLELVPKGARVVAAGARRASAVTPPPVSAAQVRAELAGIGDPAAGRRWLADQRMTVAQLVVLAGELGIATRAKARKDDLLDQVVQSLIGRRRDFEALSRPAS